MNTTSRKDAFSRVIFEGQGHIDMIHLHINDLSITGTAFIPVRTSISMAAVFDGANPDFPATASL
jgi:hypothetical protein